MKKQINYMIFYRPCGSKTWTPVPKEGMATYHGKETNLFHKRETADSLAKELENTYSNREFVVFECAETTPSKEQMR